MHKKKLLISYKSDGFIDSNLFDGWLSICIKCGQIDKNHIGVYRKSYLHPVCQSCLNEVAHQCLTCGQHLSILCPTFHYNPFPPKKEALEHINISNLEQIAYNVSKWIESQKCTPRTKNPELQGLLVELFQPESAP